MKQRPWICNTLLTETYTRNIGIKFVGM